MPKVFDCGHYNIAIQIKKTGQFKDRLNCHELGNPPMPLCLCSFCRMPYGAHGEAIRGISIGSDEMINKALWAGVLQTSLTVGLLPLSAEGPATTCKI